MQELVDNPPALFVVRPGLLDALTIMVCLGVVDQLIRLATNAPVRKSIRLIASCPPSSFEFESNTLIKPSMYLIELAIELSLHY